MPTHGGNKCGRGKWWVNSNMKNFVIFGMGRTGSSLLVSLLNSHPQICCEGELFRSLNRPLLSHFWRRYPLPYLAYRQLYIKWVEHKVAYGFKLHTKLHGDQLIYTDHFLTTVAQQGWKIIHLQRARLFDQIISGFLANQTGRYFGDQQRQEAPVQLTFPVTDFVKRIEQGNAIRRQQQTLLATIPHLPVIYEQALADQTNWVKTVARICDYLAIPATSAVTSYVQKPWQYTYAELIVNYAELQSVYQQYGSLPMPEQG